jgi:hypothetical protein
VILAEIEDFDSISKQTTSFSMRYTQMSRKSLLHIRYDNHIYSIRNNMFICHVNSLIAFRLNTNERISQSRSFSDVFIYLDSTPSTQSTSSQQCMEMRTHRETVRMMISCVFLLLLLLRLSFIEQKIPSTTVSSLTMKSIEVFFSLSFSSYLKYC